MNAREPIYDPKHPCYEDARIGVSVPKPTTEPVADVIAPCPFCGGGAMLLRMEDEDGEFAVISCQSCGACGRQHYYLGDDASLPVIAAWNTRAQAPDAVQDVKAGILFCIANHYSPPMTTLAKWHDHLSATQPEQLDMAELTQAVLDRQAPDAGSAGRDAVAVVRVARVLSDRNAAECGVNPHDNWNVYGHLFVEDARAAISALRTHAGTDAGGGE